MLSVSRLSVLPGTRPSVARPALATPVATQAAAGSVWIAGGLSAATSAAIVYLGWRKIDQTSLSKTQKIAAKVATVFFSLLIPFFAAKLLTAYAITVISSQAVIIGSILGVISALSIKYLIPKLRQRTATSTPKPPQSPSEIPQPPQGQPVPDSGLGTSMPPAGTSTPPNPSQSTAESQQPGMQDSYYGSNQRNPAASTSTLPPTSPASQKSTKPKESCTLV